MAEKVELAGQDAGIGEIRASLLKPDKFEELYGSDWFLLQRTDVTGLPIAAFLDSSLQEDGKYFLPDGRGRFLRMLDHNAGLDDKGRQPGSHQADSLKAHQHKYKDRYFSQHGKVKEGTYLGFSGKMDRKNHPDNFALDDVTENTGSRETRPHNIAVNLYIKVK